MQVYSLEMSLTSSANSSVVNIIPACTGALYSKNILIPKVCTGFKDFVKSESRVEVSRVNLFLTKPQLYLLTNIQRSWFIDDPDPSRLANTSLLGDALSHNEGWQFLNLKMTLFVVTSSSKMLVFKL